MTRGFTSTSWTFVLHSAEDEITREVVRWTYLKIHSLQVLLAARVRKSDGFGQDGEGHRQVQPHPVSYSGGRSY